MTVTDSRLKNGTLMFGPKDTPVLTVSCQATAVTLEPSFDDGDAVEVLCGDELAGATTTSWVMKFTGIQDFSDPKGFVNYAFDHNDETAEFTWTPNQDGPTYSGSVTIRAVTVGGDVATRITTDAEWPVVGKPNRADKEPTPPESKAAAAPAPSGDKK